MTLIDHTFILLNNRLSTINDNHTCFFNKYAWIRAHIGIVGFIHILLFYMYNLIVFSCALFFFFYPRWYRLLREYIINKFCISEEVTKRSPLEIIILKQEVILSLAYVCFASMYTRLELSKINHTVTNISIICWLAEASLVPVTSTAILYDYIFMGNLEDFYNYYKIYYGFTIILKIHVFMICRYAEWQPDFFTNHIKLSLVTLSC